MNYRETIKKINNENKIFNTKNIEDIYDLNSDLIDDENYIKTINEWHEENYFRKINRLVSLRMVNPNPELLKEKKIFRVKFTENWIIALAEKFDENLTFFPYLNYGPALRRGLGMCREQTFAVVSILKKNGFDAGYMMGKEHVTGWVKGRSGRIFFLDPDYGVVFNSDISPSLIWPMYYLKFLELGWTAPTDNAQKLIENHYESTKNKLWSTNFYTRVYMNNYKKWGLANYMNVDLTKLENILYICKWLIPIFFFIISSLYIFFKKNYLEKIF